MEGHVARLHRQMASGAEGYVRTDHAFSSHAKQNEENIIHWKKDTPRSPKTIEAYPALPTFQRMWAAMEADK